MREQPRLRHARHPFAAWLIPDLWPCFARPTAFLVCCVGVESGRSTTKPAPVTPAFGGTCFAVARPDVFKTDLLPYHPHQTPTRCAGAFGGGDLTGNRPVFYSGEEPHPQPPPRWRGPLPLPSPRGDAANKSERVLIEALLTQLQGVFHGRQASHHRQNH